MPEFNELKRSEELSAIIRNEIRQHGAISFERFMSLALYHPKLGYYCADTFQLGKKGDFTTAPELSPLFAKCIARQFQEVSDHLPGDMQILEMGAGSGRFAADVLTELDTLSSLPCSYYIYELSPGLRKQQQTFIKTHYPQYQKRIVWLDHLPQGFKGIIFANEVLDALPFHCFHLDTQQVKERCVSWKNDEFSWELTSPTTDQLTIAALQLQKDYHLPAGYESEINLQLATFIHSLANCLEQGVILFADYGYGQREYYHPQRNQGTLTCFHQHRMHANPLIFPGQQDITAHVDFTRVIETASAEKMTLLGYSNQASFLLACGLLDIAAHEEASLNEADRFKLHHVIKLLTLPTEMGERIKIMGLGKNIELPRLLGFRLQDRGRDL